MKIEEPAVGISKSVGQDDTYSYHIECTCTDPDHSLQVWIEVEAEDDVDDVQIIFYVQSHYQSWRGFFRRFKDAIGIIFGSPLTKHHDLLLDKQAALNFAGALTNSIDEIEKRIEERAASKSK